MTIKNIKSLRNRVLEYQSHRDYYPTHVCIGYGSGDGIYNDLNDYFGIPCSEIYALYTAFPEEGLNCNWTGSSHKKLYYVTNEFYNKYIKEDTPMKDTEEQYAEKSAAYLKLLGIEVGSLVKVTHKAETRSYGWPNSWTPAMDNTVGRNHRVTSINRDGQVRLGGYSQAFPYFVFIPVENSYKLPANIPISGSYSVVFKDDASIEVGCQTIPFTKLTEIYNAAKSVNDQL